MSIFFDYVADRLVGTNLSGMNGRDDEVVITKQQLEYANEIIVKYDQLCSKSSDLESAVDRLQNTLQIEKLGKIAYKNDLEKAEAKLNKSKNDVVENAGSLDLRISERFRIASVLENQILSYAKAVGVFDEQKGIADAINKMTLIQKYTCNLYVIAAADYALMQTHIANLIVAVDTVINKHFAGTVLPISDGEGFPQNLYELSTELKNDLIHFSRYDGTIFRDWHKNRVKELGDSVYFLPNTRVIDPDSIPAMSAADTANLLKTNKEISYIKHHLVDEAKIELDVNNSDLLIPSAYATNAFGIRDKFIIKI